MQVVVADSAGFCFGVKRAIKMAFAAARRSPNPIYSLGPLIHNPQVVGKLEEVGVRVMEDLDTVQDGTVIFRSHGVTLEETNLARERRLKIVDATCPFVKKAQKYASSLSTGGYLVVIVGDKGHPEVRGILSYIKGEGLVTESAQGLRTLSGVKKLGVIAQTTQSYKNFQEVVSQALLVAREVRAFNTICDATHIRQQESVKLAQEVDCMIVIGGYNSANTTRLANLCRQVQPNTHHVETEGELGLSWFKEVQRVGITAGASTPSWLIDRVKGDVAKIAP
ncbi:MAG: 4-hydroxy-3-methylbut-2-enyl diphosphate reductase [Deltaproteobacteria bacterium]|nr:4-hydroxy-3-methylbut-2-enyl diphosphate reductase [Deltaproteobacteria bacterium]